jgi:integrase
MRTLAQAKADRRELWRDISRDHPRQAKEKVASLRGQLREARQRRKFALRDAKERCRAERVRARQACTVRIGTARAIKDDIQRARAELVAEKQYQADLRRSELANRKRRSEAPRVTRIERQAESDDEVRGNVPPELVALFERVNRSNKASPRMSRTESFLKYAEEHPVVDQKLLALLEAAGDGLAGDRDRALLALGWFGAFRRAELVSLDVGDVVCSDEGLVVTLRRSRGADLPRNRPARARAGGTPAPVQCRARRQAVRRARRPRPGQARWALATRGLRDNGGEVRQVSGCDHAADAAPLGAGRALVHPAREALRRQRGRRTAVIGAQPEPHGHGHGSEGKPLKLLKMKRFTLPRATFVARFHGLPRRPTCRKASGGVILLWLLRWGARANA